MSSYTNVSAAGVRIDLLENAVERVVAPGPGFCSVSLELQLSPEHVVAVRCRDGLALIVVVSVDEVVSRFVVTSLPFGSVVVSLHSP